MAKSKFIGEAGEHFVAYKLARKEMYVGLTIGNMPHIDLLVSSKNGLKDRKSVVQGKSVDLGGRRIIKKKKKKRKRKKKKKKKKKT